MFVTNGLHIREIGRRLAVNASSVCRWLARAGVTVPREPVDVTCLRCFALIRTTRQRARLVKYCGEQCRAAAKREVRRG